MMSNALCLVMAIVPGRRTGTLSRAPSWDCTGLSAYPEPTVSHPAVTVVLWTSSSGHQDGAARRDVLFIISASLSRRVAIADGRLRIVAGAGDVFHRLDGAEKGAEAEFVALVILLLEQRLDGRCTVGVSFRLAGLGQGQLCLDVEFELVQEGVVAGWGAHLEAPSGWGVVGLVLDRLSQSAKRVAPRRGLSPGTRARSSVTSMP